MSKAQCTPQNKQSYDRMIQKAKNYMAHYLMTNDEEHVLGLLRNKFPVRVTLEGLPLLHFAVMHDVSAPILSALLAYGADIQAKTWEGRTVCHWVCRMARQDLLQLLVAKIEEQGLEHMWSERSCGMQTPAMCVLQNWKTSNELIQYCIAHLGL